MTLKPELFEKIENDFAGASICITDANLNKPGPIIEYVSEAFTELTGYSPAEVIGKSPRLLQGPHTERFVLDRLTKDLKENGSFHGSAINYRKDGSEFYMAWSIMPIENDGVVTHYVATQTNATQTMVIHTLKQIESGQKSILERLIKLERLI